jgi:Domain of unknown function (DUF1906)
MAISRRDLLKCAAAAPAVLGVGGALAAAGTPTASAAPLGILLDYAAGVIRATDIRASGAAGAIRYVSDRRPGGAWMLGKPIQLPEARDLYQSGLKIVSCYQYGKQDTADWLGGQNAGVQHAKRGWQLHVGVYANSKTIDWAIQDGLGSYFWQHNWGSPAGFTHPAAALHQVEIDKRSVGGVGVDLNHVLKPAFGQWD